MTMSMRVHPVFQNSQIWPCRCLQILLHHLHIWNSHRAAGSQLCACHSAGEVKSPQPTPNPCSVSLGLSHLPLENNKPFCCLSASVTCIWIHFRHKTWQVQTQLRRVRCDVFLNRYFVTEIWTDSHRAGMEFGNRGTLFQHFLHYQWITSCMSCRQQLIAT